MTSYRTGLIVAGCATILLISFFIIGSFLQSEKTELQEDNTNKETSQEHIERLVIDPAVLQSPQSAGDFAAYVQQILDEEDVLLISDTNNAESQKSEQAGAINTPASLSSSGATSREIAQKQSLNVLGDVLGAGYLFTADYGTTFNQFFLGEPHEEEVIDNYIDYLAFSGLYLSDIAESNVYTNQARSLAQYSRAMAEHLSSIQQLGEGSQEITSERSELLMLYLSAAQNYNAVITSLSLEVRAKNMNFGPEEPGQFFVFSL